MADPIEPKAKAAMAFCGLRILFVASLCLLWCSVPFEAAFAYVDPSVMTYTIQAVAGVAVALSAVAGVVFRRTRRKLYQLLKIDENAGKIVEDDVGAVDPDSAQGCKQLETAAFQAEETKTTLRALEAHAPLHSLGWRGRFGYALLICLFMAFIVFIAPALEVVGANGDSLVFGLSTIGWIPTVFCTVIAIVVALLVSQLQGRGFYLTLLVLFALTLAAYVQSLFLNQGMMPADGGYLGWHEWYFVSKMIFSGIVWIAIVALFVILSRHRRHLWLKGCAIAACCLIVMQLAGVVSILSEGDANPPGKGRPYVTQQGLLSVSPQKNALIFVLDTYDTKLLNQILEEEPNFLADFTGFTYFEDSLGTMIPTSNAIPYLVSGVKPAPDQTMGDYRQHRYEASRFVPDLHAMGYDIGIYTDALMMDFQNPADQEIARDTVNIHPVDRAPVDIVQTFLATMQCALYREAPWVMKPLFWYYTSEINNRMIANDETNLNDSLYELDDAAILDLLRAQKVKADATDCVGSFRFIHLFGPHFPFSVDENGKNIGTNRSDQMAQARGSMRVVAEYLNQLKELGVYDDAAVIVTADHGIWDLSQDPIEWAVSPIMLAKPPYAKGSEAAQAPVRLSPMPVSHEDIQATIMAAIGGNEAAYGTSLFSVDDPQRIRTFIAQTSKGNTGQWDVEYAVEGNALDVGNWSKTGVEWSDY